MTIHVSWDDNNRRNAIVLTFCDKWSWHDCKDAMQTAMYLRESVEHNVSFIYDITHNRLTARETLDHIHKLMNLALYPAPASVVIVEKGQHIQMLMDTLDTLFVKAEQQNVQFADNLARARAITAIA